MRKLKVLELFGGIGAPRKALEDLGFDIKHIDYVEIWDWAVLAYNSMFNNNYNSQNILSWNLNVDLLVHGSPCVDFSRANNNDEKSGASMLYKETLEIIEKRLNPRPKYIVWENVKSLVTNKKFKPHFENYLEVMESYGYKNYYKVLNSRDFGTSQNRERVFVVSIRNDIDSNFNFNNLEIKNHIPLKNSLVKLDKNTIKEQKLQVTQPSMLWAIKNKKVYALDVMNVAYTLTTKMMRWYNAGVIPYKLDKNDKLVQLSNNENIYSHEFTKNNEKYIDFYAIPEENYTGLKSTRYVGEMTDKQFNIIQLDNSSQVYFRYLDPLECFRLMGFKDSDHDACKRAGISKNKMYHLTGNSMDVNILKSIFKLLS